MEACGRSAIQERLLSAPQSQLTGPGRPDRGSYAGLAGWTVRTSGRTAVCVNTGGDTPLGVLGGLAQGGVRCSSATCESRCL
ncbi:unnamed protein product [Boreogadus saida]